MSEPVLEDFPKWHDVGISDIDDYAPIAAGRGYIHKVYIPRFENDAFCCEMYGYLDCVPNRKSGYLNTGVI